MPRLLVMSDLHIEFGDLEVPDVDVDVVVLAGDIHVGTAAAQWSEDLAWCLGVPVVLIAGNHEHYRTARTLHGSMKQNLLDYRAAGERSEGRLIFLERASALVAGVRFLGCTLWTDFGLFGNPPVAMSAAARGMNDFRLIAYEPGVLFTPEHAREEFEQAKAFLADELAKAFNGPTVVVTHHSPSLRSVPEPFKTDILSAAYSSNLEEFVATSGAALWIHGHHHHSCDYTVGTTRVVSNPRGYAGHEPNPNSDPGLVVGVDDPHTGQNRH
jgi:calcineurin-like phosphoesterase family protein